MLHDLNRALDELQASTGIGSDPHQDLTGQQTETLRRAVAKLVLLGERAGVSIDQMILLLDSGLTLGELLDYVTHRSESVA